MPENVTLKPVLAFKSRIIYLKTAAKGRSISYGRTYRAKKSTVIATIPAGYADGYARALSNKARVLVRGRFCPVAGRVCMDQTMIDVGHVPGVGIGDTVVLIGTQQGKTVYAEEIARLCRTIPYEITCGISPRVNRIFDD